MRPALALLGVLALAACDPAGPATVGLIPVGTVGDGAAEGGGGGAPLDPMRADASLVGNSTATTDPAPEAPEEGDATELAAAATAAVAGTPAPAALSTNDAVLAEYADTNTHPVGSVVHSRDFASPERADRACARYASADQAQSAFLAAGGPGQDPRGLDPDGDGYACGWDPEAYQSRRDG